MLQHADHRSGGQDAPHPRQANPNREDASQADAGFWANPGGEPVDPMVIEEPLSAQETFRRMDGCWLASTGRFTFGQAPYFDMVKVCQAVAHPLAAAQPVFTPAWGRQLDARSGS